MNTPGIMVLLIGFSLARLFYLHTFDVFAFHEKTRRQYISAA